MEEQSLAIDRIWMTFYSDSYDSEAKFQRWLRRLKMPPFASCKHSVTGLGENKYHIVISEAGSGRRLWFVYLIAESRLAVGTLKAGSKVQTYYEPICMFRLGDLETLDCQIANGVFLARGKYRGEAKDRTLASLALPVEGVIRR